MSDLPEQYVLQQQCARPVSGEELEAFGKKASASWRSGECETLNKAVVETVKHAQLSPEQIRRVIEFTNQDAYLVEFRKEGKHKVVHFDCGPADPSDVLKDLNDGGGGTVFDTGAFDYFMPPKMGSSSTPLEKTAAEMPEEFNPYEDALLHSFAVEPEKIANSDPSRPARELWYDLTATSNKLANDINSLEIDFLDSGARMLGEVKQAARSGYALGEIVSAWSTVSDNPALIKAAFSFMGPDLKKEFGSYDAVGASLEKKASRNFTVNADHKVVTEYQAFCEILNKLANLRELKNDVDESLAQAEELMKNAGAINKAWGALGQAGGAAGDTAATLSKWLVDPKTVNPSTVKNVVQKGVQYGGAGGALLAANAAQQEITDRPIVRKGLGAARAIVPGTQEYNLRRAKIMSGGMY